MKKLKVITKDALLYFWIWFGTKVLGWKYVDLCLSLNKKDVLGVTFSMKEKYVNKVSKIKL